MNYRISTNALIFIYNVKQQKLENIINLIINFQKI